MSGPTDVVPGDPSSVAARAVLTIAVGKAYYTGLAVNLARSFVHWHRESDIAFHLVTNRPELIPPDLSSVTVRRAPQALEGRGFTAKLYLDQLAPAQQTLFVDADCLCFGRLEPVFDRFAGRGVSVIGRLIEEGEFFGRVEDVRKQFSVAALTQFVGGVYYLERGATASRVFDTARGLEPRYDAIGLRRLRGLPNEEPLISIAMALHGQTPVAEDGSIKADAMHYPSGMRTDVLAGRALVVNDPADPRRNRSWSIASATPLIVHFNASFAEKDPYLREALRLELVLARRWPVGLATAYARLTKTLPESVISWTKDRLRPIYRRLIGVRPVARSPRV